MNELSAGHRRGHALLRETAVELAHGHPPVEAGLIGEIQDLADVVEIAESPMVHDRQPNQVGRTRWK